MYERLPETIRVNLTSVGLDDYYVLVLPSIDEPLPHRDFFLVYEPLKKPKFMFGCKADTSEEAAQLAEANALDYI